MKFTLASALFLAATASAAVPSLTPENYDSMTSGKSVFIKFFAPWCGHCKKMAPDWEKLASDWAGHDVGLVAEVDCTAAGKPLCDQNGVKGFPTLKYGDPASLDDYQGGRSYGDLSKFATENLKPNCSPTNIDLCDDEKKAQIEKYSSMPVSDLNALIATEEKKLDDAQALFKSEVEKLQSQYQNLVSNKDATIINVKQSGLGLMKSILAAGAKGSDEL